MGSRSSNEDGLNVGRSNDEAGEDGAVEVEVEATELACEDDDDRRDERRSEKGICAGGWCVGIWCSKKAGQSSRLGLVGLVRRKEGKERVERRGGGV